MNISLDRIEQDGGKFEEIEFGTVHESAEKLKQEVIVYEQQLSKFIDYAKIKVHAHKLRNDMSEKLTTKLRREGRNMGILPPEIDEVVGSVLS